MGYIDDDYNNKLKYILYGSGLKKNDLILPLFLQNENKTKDISSMPGIYKISEQNIILEIGNLLDHGISSFLLFGVPKIRDRFGSSAISKDNIVQKAIRDIKNAFGNSLTVISDVCLCQYNLSGHCGIIDDVNSLMVNNDATIPVLSKIALSHAQAGSDIVAPSSMMDGQVKSIRDTLDREGFSNVKILSFSAKHSSSLYTPFRSANYLSRDIQLDKRTYQSSYHNSFETMREILSDIDEGADIVMIKPALYYLDLIYKIKKTFNFPLAVQNVSGEYSMLIASSRSPFQIYENAIFSISSIKRAGADVVISYFAKEIANLL